MGSAFFAGRLATGLAAALVTAAALACGAPARAAAPGLQPAIAWHRVENPLPSPGQAITNLAYDSTRDRLVAINPLATGPRYFTWERDKDGHWTRSGFLLHDVFPLGMADDPALGGVVLLTITDPSLANQQQGQTPARTLDTWLWNGTRWSRIATGGIVGTPFAASLAYDPVSKRLLLFGGSPRPGTAGNTPYDATYALGSDGQWREDLLGDTIVPQPRDFAAFGADPQSSRMVLFGGAPQGLPGDDTWLLDTGALRLHKVGPSSAPPHPPTNPPPSPGPAPPQLRDWLQVDPQPHPAHGSWWAVPDTDRLYLTGLDASGAWQDWAWEGLRRIWTRVDGGGPRPAIHDSLVATIDTTRHRVFAAGRAGEEYQLWEGDLSGPQLVGLGDSYAAGEGVPPYVAGTNMTGNFCHRSVDAYPLVAAQSLGLTGANFACSGASIVHLTTAGPKILEWADNVHETQLDRGEAENIRAEPQIVALTIGANDLRITDALQTCIQDFVATELAPWLAGIKLPVVHCSNQPPLAGFARSLPGIAKQLTTALNALAESPNLTHAHFYVLGYPNIFSVPPQFGFFGPPNTEWVSRSDVQTLIRDTATADNAMAGAVAATNDPSRFTYVDDYGIFAGHELGGGDQWVNGFHYLADDSYGNIDAFHPTKDGQAAMAACLVDAVNRKPCPGAGSASSTAAPPPAPTPPPTPSPGPKPEPAVFLSPDSAAPGGPPITLQLRRLEPNSAATLTWHSNATGTRTLHADAHGAITAAVVPPRGLRPGVHTLAIDARRAHHGLLRVRARVSVLGATAFRRALAHYRRKAPPVATPQGPSSSSWLPFAAIGLALGLGAFVTLRLRRRQGRGPPGPV